jgi:two-component system LytT family sensor kinase
MIVPTAVERLPSPAAAQSDTSRAAARAFAAGARRYAIAFGGWTAVGIFLAQQEYARGRIAGRHVAWSDGLPGLFADIWLWALFTPAILDIARLFPFDRERWARYLPLHLIAALAFAALDALVMWSIGPYVSPLPPLGLGAEFSRRLFTNEASYVVLAAISIAGRYAEQSRERELAAVGLAKELADARLAALNAQLRPHFLFNTLNAIAELVHVDPDAADRTVTALGGLLRRSLAANDRQTVSLREELACVDEYLAIVATRLEERLRVTTQIAPDVLDARVPSFLLQPLVENAVRHGIERTTDGGQLEIVARRADGVLHLEVRDDGAGLTASAGSPVSGGGHGLRTTRERLRQLYGDAQRFELRPNGERGAVAAVQLPYTSVTLR